MNPVRTDRLAVGHIATFVWYSCNLEPQIGSYYVVREHTDPNSTNLPTATTAWLHAFMGKPRRHFGIASAPEDNIIHMMLANIRLPTATKIEPDSLTPSLIKKLEACAA